MPDIHIAAQRFEDNKIINMIHNSFRQSDAYMRWKKQPIIKFR